ncbi:O-antigen ligase family protein [Microvirga sp. 2TAF3]|uniref:O-antigen ligase family protein n=1 Tax=Microvirga sp. 2TAF3 TaxID=3233014 RepID=UPI003F989D8F
MRMFDPASASPPRNGFRAHLAEAMWRAAIIVLVLMPVGMAIAHRSSPAFLTVAALCALGAIAAEGQGRRFGQDVWTALASPLGLAVLAFLAWCVVSIGWSEFKRVSIEGFGEFWLAVAGAFILGLTLPQRMTRSAFWLLIGASIAACCMMIFELRTGLALRKSLGMRWQSFIFNRSVLTLLCLTPPLVAWLLRNVRFGWVFSMGFAALVFTTIAHSESGASVLGFMAFCVTFLVAYAAPRLVAIVAAVAFVLLTASAPFLGKIADWAIPASVHERLANDHSRDRVDIWLSFGEAIRQQPLLGAGFGISPRMRDTSVAERVPTEDETLLAVGHPHNAIIQIWVELGAVGAVLALATILLLLRAIARQSRLIAGVSLALMAGVTGVALVGHGAWQGWWAASLGAAIVWMLAVRRKGLETKP